MKIQIERAVLIEATNFCQRVAEKRSTMPILSQGLISCSSDKGFQVITTDLEVYAQTSIACQVEEEGKCCIPIRNFSSIIRDLPSNEAQIELNRNQVLEISSGQAVFRLNTLPAEDFPVFEDIGNGKSTIKVDSSLLRGILDYTLFSASSDETQSVLNSILFDFSQKKQWKVASTDRHRLSYFDVSRHESKVEGLNLVSLKKTVLPKKGAQELRNLCELAGEEKTICFQESKKALCFQFENYLLVVRILKGDYPTFDHILSPPEDFAEVVVDRELFVSALRRTSLLSSEKMRAIQMTFSSKSLDLYCVSETLGDARETLPVKSVKGLSGDRMIITVNARYVLEPLSVIMSDQIRIFVRDKRSHLIIQPGEREDYRVLIMPLRI